MYEPHLVLYLNFRGYLDVHGQRTEYVCNSLVIVQCVNIYRYVEHVTVVIIQYKIALKILSN